MPDLAYAKTGPGRLFNSIGWFNFDSLPSNFVSPLTVTLSNNIKDGGKVEFCLKITSSSDANFEKQVPPLSNNTAFSRTAYKGISSPVCLKGVTDFAKSSAQIEITNLKIYNKYDEIVNNYIVYFLDSKNPKSKSFQTSTTNGSEWIMFYTFPSNFKRKSNINGLGTNTITSSSTGYMPILYSKNATSIVHTFTGQTDFILGVSFSDTNLRTTITTTIPVDSNTSNDIKIISDSEVISDNEVSVLTKSVDRKYAKIGDILTYTVSFENNGNTTAHKVTFNTTIADNTTFEPESLFINNVQSKSTSPTKNKLKVSINNIEPNGVATLTYKVNISTFPSPNPILSSTNVSYIKNNKVLSITSNTVDSQVNSANLDNVSKFVTKPSLASIEDILTYTINIPNTGNVTATNVIMHDNIPFGTSLINNSVLVNGLLQKNALPESGLNVGSIPPGTTATISYNVKVLHTSL